MVYSLEEIDAFPLSNPGNAPPITAPLTDPGEGRLIPPPTNENTEDSAASQDNPSLAIPALDPALAALSPPTPDRAMMNPVYHGEDLTQLARHLALQKTLSKHNTDELVQFAKVFSSSKPPIHPFLS